MSCMRDLFLEEGKEQKCKTLGVGRICIERNSVAMVTPILYLSMVPKDAVSIIVMHRRSLRE